MLWVIFICTGAFIYWIWSLYELERNVKLAKTAEIPVVRVQVDAMNLLWHLFEPYFCLVFDLFHIGQGDFKRYARWGWFWREKEISHLQRGSVWALCSPVNVFINVADPMACREIFRRNRDFVRPNHLYAMMRLYGPNVATVGRADWQRQRKILGAPFHEGTMGSVWAETLTQARDMLRNWEAYGMKGVPGMGRDMRTLSLDVLATIGFQRSYKFKPYDKTVSEDPEAQDYRDALGLVLDNALTLMALPSVIFSFPFLPRKMRLLGLATERFRRYMLDMLETESKLISKGETGTSTLMTSFARALHDGRKTVDIAVGHNAPHSIGLNIEEVLGNIFAINFAGHDTTANTLAFAMLMLAACPDVQNWLSEEIQANIEESSGVSWEYEKLFPRLKRCQAVMYETLRLFPPILALPKYSPRLPQSLPLSDGRVLEIPPGVTVMPSVLAIHMLPEYWGNDAREWKPARWIRSEAGTEPETIIVPKLGTYFPWSEGAYNCPGVKFSQVEFVAVMAVLFLEHRVQPLLKMGEDMEMARKRVINVANDCGVTLLLRMKDADTIRLVWQRS